MASEARRVAVAVAALPTLLLLALPLPVGADQAWWEPLAFAGERVSDVVAGPGLMVVATPSGDFASTDGGRSFQPVSTTQAPPAAPPASIRWEIDNGTVVTGQPGRPLAADPGAPYLGATAHQIAAPAALPGVVVAVGSDNHVWRRSPSGRWATSFILLPAGGLSGTPRVTSLAAFTAPLSVAVYMGTAGYGVLLSEDGGDDWIRADPGLPEDVLALATDASVRSLYAATGDGLWVHRLQSFPAPPVYHDAALYLRWLGIAAVALVALLLAVIGLRLALPPRGRPRE